MVILGVLLAIVLFAMGYSLYTIGKGAGSKGVKEKSSYATAFHRGYAQAVCDHRRSGKFMTDDQVIGLIVDLMEQDKNNLATVDTAEIKD